ncbi:MAG: hypothetical protein AAFN51_13000, partial [Pseudomonadota bacterium]
DSSIQAAIESGDENAAMQIMALGAARLRIADRPLRSTRQRPTVCQPADISAAREFVLSYLDQT